jgi:SAM-dependent methyltransferase
MSEFDQKRVDDAYPEGIEDGFWSLARNRIIERALRSAVRQGLRSPTGRILEVGCGPGIVVAALRSQGHDVWGVELGEPAVRAAAAPYVTVGTRAEDLDGSFRDSIETVLLLDVIEHVEDDVAFLASVLSACPRCRCVIVTVPARPEVWSNYDEYFGHFRRYTRETLDGALRQAGVQPVAVRYFFHALYLAARLINALGRKRTVSFARPSALPLQRLVAAGLGLEDRLIGSAALPGLSLLAVARVAPGRAEGT